jgi:hypothetical protein
MSILKHIKRHLFTRQEVFEINSDNSLLSSYAIRSAQGEGGQPDPRLAALLAWNALKLEQQREEAQSQSEIGMRRPLRA